MRNSRRVWYVRRMRKNIFFMGILGVIISLLRYGVLLMKKMLRFMFMMFYRRKNSIVVFIVIVVFSGWVNVVIW